jgi:hypothetical protein
VRVLWGWFPAYAYAVAGVEWDAPVLDGFVEDQVRHHEDVDDGAPRQRGVQLTDHGLDVLPSDRVQR